MLSQCLLEDHEALRTRIDQSRISNQRKAKSMSTIAKFDKYTEETPKPPGNQKSWLIVAPHADDEIFAIPIILYAKAQEINTDILILGASSRRKEEALLAGRYLNAEITLAADLGFAGKDGRYHEKIRELVELICLASSKYDKVLAPALEGGHQDHDTAWLAVAVADAINKTNKGLYYHTYTAIGKLGLFITCPSNNFYCPGIFTTSWKSNRWIYPEQIYLASRIYKSQHQTWILLLVGLLVKLATGSMQQEVVSCKHQDFDSIFRSLDTILAKDCLFAIHGRLAQSSWRKHALKAVMIYNQMHHGDTDL